MQLAFALLSLGMIIAKSKDNTGSDVNIIFLVMMAALYGIIHFFITRNKISVDEEGITQSSLFIKNRKLLWNEILSSEIAFRFMGKSSKYQ